MVQGHYWGDATPPCEHCAEKDALIDKLRAERDDAASYIAAELDDLRRFDLKTLNAFKLDFRDQFSRQVGKKLDGMQRQLDDMQRTLNDRLNPGHSTAA